MVIYKSILTAPQTHEKKQNTKNENNNHPLKKTVKNKKEVHKSLYRLALFFSITKCFYRHYDYILVKKINIFVT